MKRYFISIDLDIAGVIADSEEKALKIAKSQVEAGCYSLNIVDTEEAK